MIGGQTADVLGESQPLAPELAEYIDEHKTASLFQVACELGALAGHGCEAEVLAFGQFGLHVGCAFQIADDLLDVSATADVMGKKVGKDAAANKQTLPQCLGIEQSRIAASEAVAAAIAAIESFGTEAEDLRSLARYVADRNY
jgi:geranylgeranyl pyrophosphate synthase